MTEAKGEPVGSVTFSSAPPEPREVVKPWGMFIADNLSCLPASAKAFMGQVVDSVLSETGEFPPGPLADAILDDPSLVITRGKISGAYYIGPAK